MTITQIDMCGPVPVAVQVYRLGDDLLMGTYKFLGWAVVSGELTPVVLYRWAAEPLVSVTSGGSGRYELLFSSDEPIETAIRVSPGD